MATSSKSSKHKRGNAGTQPPKKPTGKATKGDEQAKKRKRTVKEKSRPTSKLVDESEHEEEEAQGVTKKPTGKATKGDEQAKKWRRTVKEKSRPTSKLVDEFEHEGEEAQGVTKKLNRGAAKTRSRAQKPPSRGVVIREPGAQATHTRRKKKNEPKGKGKQRASPEPESESESDSNFEITDANMSDEDEGEPVERAEWEAKFVSAKAYRAYNQILKPKAHMPERPIFGEPLSKKYEDFWKSLLEVQKWGPILRGHGKANLSIVREFYANWRHTRGRTVRVRGIDIEISAQALNRYLEVPDANTEMYKSMCSNPDYSRIQEILCPGRSDATWKSGNTPHHSLAKEFMCSLARVVLNLICNRLMPCQHKTHVPRYRVLLLYALMESVPINLGEIMYEQMQRTRMSSNLALFFANTLSAYLTYIGVAWDDEKDDIEELEYPEIYDITTVRRSSSDRTSNFTTQQLFAQVQEEIRETKAELSATRGELIQIHATQAEQTTMIREMILLIRAFVGHADLDILPILARDPTEPSSSAPPDSPRNTQ
ncbi:hypothetical protein RND71_022118 [Anisodus tanguticus]|uniref:Putative plant transposon protein domain-containing protein n=1 Tax=Anisodus tanguticus TaxID=243964 RepID=A0AAE1VFW4_9SOLA|nr:hypothetical protein RND71_022118 [Anisodus tanguticus]